MGVIPYSLYRKRGSNIAWIDNKGQVNPLDRLSDIIDPLDQYSDLVDPSFYVTVIVISRAPLPWNEWFITGLSRIYDV